MNLGKYACIVLKFILPHTFIWHCSTLQGSHLMVCNRSWHLSGNPKLVWHPAQLINEWGCVDLSMDTLHLQYPLVLFGSEGSALTLPLFHLTPRITTLSLFFNNEKGPLFANTLFIYSFIHWHCSIGWNRFVLHNWNLFVLTSFYHLIMWTAGDQESSRLLNELCCHTHSEEVMVLPVPNHEYWPCTVLDNGHVPAQVRQRNPVFT